MLNLSNIDYKFNFNEEIEYKLYFDNILVFENFSLKFEFSSKNFFIWNNNSKIEYIYIHYRIGPAKLSLFIDGTYIFERVA